jgi:hypothetical protein
VAALAAVLSAETLLMLGATALTAVQLGGHAAKVEVDGLAYLVCAAIGCLWVGSCAVGGWLGQGWIRGLAITWQLVQLAIGVGALEGLVGTPPVGIVLLVLGLAGFALVVAPPVTRALAKER